MQVQVIYIGTSARCNSYDTYFGFMIFYDMSFIQYAITINTIQVLVHYQYMLTRRKALPNKFLSHCHPIRIYICFKVNFVRVFFIITMCQYQYFIPNVPKLQSINNYQATFLEAFLGFITKAITMYNMYARARCARNCIIFAPEEVDVIPDYIVSCHHQVVVLHFLLQPETL